MDLLKNRIPEGVQTIHLIAVCGTGMGALACMLKDLGFEITGSDQKVYPPMSTFLQEKGIEIFNGFNGANISYGPDLVIVGNAVSKDNPEVVRMLEMGFYFCSMPQALNRFVGEGKKTILVTGTHGKTTTSSIIAWILAKAGFDPGFMIGGILRNFNSNYRLGKGEYLVIEGDEYDTAFFDKGPKFLHYDPAITILTSVEFDHADIFNDLDHVREAFGSLISGLSEKSLLVACDNDDNINDLIKNRACTVEKYGKDPKSIWRIGQVRFNDDMSYFDVFKDGRQVGNYKTGLMGEHNLLNTLSAIAAADHLHIESSVIADALETFQTPKRRQEIRGTKNGITVMDDFAHHPTAVRETINAVKPFFPDGRIIAVFEPRTNSSMRNVFQDVYPRSFDKADLICIRKPSMLEKIPVEIRFSSEKLADDLKKLNKDAYFFSETESIIDFLKDKAKPGDLILVMSNGGFDNIHERLLEEL